MCACVCVVHCLSVKRLTNSSSQIIVWMNAIEENATLLKYTDAVAFLQKKILHYKSTQRIEQCAEANSELVHMKNAWSRRLAARYRNSGMYAAVYNIAVLAVLLWTASLLYRRVRLVLSRWELHGQYVELCRTNAEVRAEKKRLRSSNMSARRQATHVLHCVALKAVAATIILIMFINLPNVTHFIIKSAFFHWLGGLVPLLLNNSSSTASSSSWSLLFPLTRQGAVLKLANKVHICQSVYLWYCFGSAIFTTVKILLDSMSDNAAALIESTETRARGRAPLLTRIDESIYREERAKRNASLHQRITDMCEQQASLQAAIEQLREGESNLALLKKKADIDPNQEVCVTHVRHTTRARQKHK